MRHRPFSSGSQSADWDDRNCQRCTKSFNNTRGDDDLNPCPIENELTVAYFKDGTVSEEIAERMGYLDKKEAYGWMCKEFEAVEADGG